MATATTTRRAAISAIGSIAATAILATHAAQAAPAVERSAWNQAWRQYQRASAAYQADHATYSPLHAAHEAAAPSEDTISWRAFAGQDHMDVIHRLDLDAYQRRLEEGGAMRALSGRRHGDRAMSALHIRYGNVEALPLDILLSSIPSLPRVALDRLVERAIEQMDEQDGDPDFEANGDEQDTGNAEDEPFAGIPWGMGGPGCPITDPGEDEHDMEEDRYS